MLPNITARFSVLTKVIETCIQWHRIPLHQVMAPYDVVECMLATCILYNNAKHKCKYLDSVNRIKIWLKTRHHAKPTFTLVVKHTIKDYPVMYCYGHQADSPCCWKRCRTVRSDTCCLKNDPFIHHGLGLSSRMWIIFRARSCTVFHMSILNLSIENSANNHTILNYTSRKTAVR